MNIETKGELIGQLCKQERTLKAVADDIFYLSCQVEKLVDNLCKVNNDEYLIMIQDVQYVVGKMKGALK